MVLSHLVLSLLGLLNFTEKASPFFASPTRYEYAQQHMGTQFRIVLYCADKGHSDRAATAAFERIRALDLIMSDYNPRSELMQLCKKNDSYPGKPLKVSNDLFTVLTVAQSLAERSQGTFDVTVSPLVRLWRLSRRTQLLPEQEELQNALQKTGYQKLILDPASQSIQMKVPGMRLDLGGIAKGYAADEVLKLLRNEFQIDQALVAASGDIACGLPPPGQKGWHVEIQPLSKNGPVRVVSLSNAAVSTSGDLEQFVEIQGIRYSHIVDPKTGIGLTGFRSVTVIAPKGIHADSLTKVASILPANKAFHIIQSIPGCEAFIAMKESYDSKEVTSETKGFSRFLIKK